jgi:hypothetical protein
MIHQPIRPMAGKENAGGRSLRRTGKKGFGRDGNTHAASFTGDSVELDALPPHILRDMVREVIERHITSRALASLRAAEESERDLLTMWSRQLPKSAP